ncbi:sigma-54-dependent transcriptional regulator [Achromobacter piechaudii]|uniref:sigma-54-dependent transcriptional regulator n=1 Tax=Achromobacter piechaudii TaxID=72556 RepID=UPI001583D4D5|nr:sigma-54 dependent transcriptional regulator [Achromobacter piechaudii]
MIQPYVCLIEDDAIMGESIVERFRLEGIRTDWFSKANDAKTAIQINSYGAVISDIRLPDLDGDELYRQLVAQGCTLPPFILMTAYATVEKAVDLLKLGIKDYVTKPFEIASLIQTVQDVLPIDVSPESQTELGVSQAAKNLHRLVPRVAGRASAVLLIGESGVGKEVLARLIHSQARREIAKRPFVAVNCGAIAPTIAEAEFFGYEKGAYTGADKVRKGYLEQADGGTLFLDEVGELSPSLQAALLRAIQEKRIRRLGAEHDTHTKFDLICATNRNLSEMVAAKSFREDLYYRINTVTLEVKPLRERPEDVLWLAKRFAASIAERLGEPAKTLHPLSLIRLQTYPWPGNIRELHNRIERACLVSQSNMLMPGEIFPEEPDGTHYPDELPTQEEATLTAYQQVCERLYIEEVLRRHGGRIQETADVLSISRKNLWQKMKRYGIDSKNAGD